MKATRKGFREAEEEEEPAPFWRAKLSVAHAAKTGHVKGPTPAAAGVAVAGDGDEDDKAAAAETSPPPHADE